MKVTLIFELWCRSLSVETHTLSLMTPISPRHGSGVGVTSGLHGIGVGVGVAVAVGVGVGVGLTTDSSFDHGPKPTAFTALTWTVYSGYPVACVSMDVWRALPESPAICTNLLTLPFTCAIARVVGENGRAAIRGGRVPLNMDLLTMHPSIGNCRFTRHSQRRCRSHHWGNRR